MDTGHQDDDLFDPWDFVDPEAEEDLPGPPAWRRPAMVIIAVITALALAVVPLYNLFGRTPPLSDSGLEICGFDYCLVQEGVIESGLAAAMGRLSNTFLNDDQAVGLADAIAAFLGVEPVPLTVVDRLEGRLGGVYNPATRSILIQRPARAWTVAHEMAHVVATGHGEAFIEALVGIVRWLEETGGNR